MGFIHLGSEDMKMSKIKIPASQLCEAIENLSPAEFGELNRLLDQKRRNRLREIAEKARRKAAGTTPEEAERILRDAIAEVRAENAADCRP